MHVVLLRDKEDDSRVKRRIEVTKELMPEASGISEVFSHGKTKEARLLSLIHIGDFFSLYLAFLYNQDPKPCLLYTSQAGSDSGSIAMRRSCLSG